MKAGSAGGDRPGRRAQAVGAIRHQRRDRHLVLHAGQVREAVARGDAVIDHLQMRRQHRDADPQDGFGAMPSAMISFSAWVAAMVWRAAHQGLNEVWLSASAPSPPPSSAALGATPKMFFRKSPSAIFTSEVNPAPAASAACRPRAGRMADREPARRGRRRVVAGARRRHDQRG